MKYEDKIEKLNELNQESCIFLLDGFEDALIGYEYTFNNVIRAVYDVDKCIEILMTRDGMSNTEAWEYLEYNTLSAINTSDNRFPILIQHF